VLKEREFRLDGVLCPQSEDLTVPMIFLEAQMQADTGFYGRYFAEIFRKDSGKRVDVHVKKCKLRKWEKK